MRGFQNLNEVSKILQHHLNHFVDGLIPTVCQDRFDHLENLHDYKEEYYLIETEDNEEYTSDDIIGLDEVAELLSKGYEDIRASNPDIWSTEKQIDEIIARDLNYSRV